MNTSTTVMQESGLGAQRGGADVLSRHTSGRRIRLDALPEHVDYRDGGCEFATSCLRCPLERCRYEKPGSSRLLRQTPRDRALRQRRSEGAPIETIALEFGLSRRSVFRILAQERAA